MAWLRACGNNEKGGSIEVVGEVNSDAGVSFDIKTLFPDVDYTVLSESNFLMDANCSVKSGSKNVGTWSGNLTPWNYYGNAEVSTFCEKVYDSSTGVLTVTAYTYMHTWQGYNVDAYTWNHQYYKIPIPCEVYMISGT